MVAVFGSRPCGVLATERSPAPLIVGLRARDIVANSPSHEPRAATVASLAHTAPGVRAPAASHGSSANTSPVELIAWRSTLGRVRHHAAAIPRRAPCAACGNGSPYDATAPPRRAWLLACDRRRQSVGGRAPYL